MRILRSSLLWAVVVGVSGEKRGDVVGSVRSRSIGKVMVVGGSSCGCDSGCCEVWFEVVIRTSVSSGITEDEASCVVSSDESASGARCRAVGAGILILLW